jgi:hypothetical protein
MEGKMNARILDLLFCCSLFFCGCFDFAAQNVQRRQTYAESHPNLEHVIRNAIFNRRIITGLIKGVRYNFQEKRLTAFVIDDPFGCAQSLP